MKPVPYLIAEAGVLGSSFVLSIADVNVSEGALTGGAVGSAIVLGTFLVNQYLRVREDRSKAKAVDVETDQEAQDRQVTRDRKIRKDALDEWRQTVADLRSDRDLDRQELHGLRDVIQAERLEHALTKRRLDDCESDRKELFERVSVLEQANKDRT